MVFKRMNIGIDDEIEHYPLFAAAFIRDMWEAEDWMLEFTPLVPFDIEDVERRTHG